MKFSPLRQRIRDYEDAYRIKFPKRTPIIIRVDGRAFHTLMRGFQKPWDPHFIKAMNSTAKGLCEEVQEAQLAYVQSDEITVFVRNYDHFDTSPWFNNSLQKMCSISAAVATVAFNEAIEAEHYSHGVPQVTGMFDSRIFCVPRKEVCNVFIDRQIDCIRNSKLSLGQHVIGKKKIHGMDQNDITEALKRDHGVDWENENSWHKYGRLIHKIKVMEEIKPKAMWPVPDGGVSVSSEGILRTRWGTMTETPVLKKSRDWVDSLVWPDEEEGRYSTYYDQDGVVIVREGDRYPCTRLDENGLTTTKHKSDSASGLCSDRKSDLCGLIPAEEQTEDK